jgi:hypothetical protein
MYGKAERIKTDRRTRVAILSLFVAVTVLFTFVISPNTSGSQVYAADYELWEDCDWDGYDDHTGVKVPWVGFDGTRGDTPAGPSPDSQTGKKKAAEEKAAAEKAEADKAAKEKKAKEKAAAAKAKAEKEKAAKDKAAKDKAAKDNPATEKTDTGSDTKTDNETDKTTDKDTQTDTETEEPEVETEEPITEAAIAPLDEPLATEATIVALDEPALSQDEIDEAIVQQQGEIEVDVPEGAVLHAGGDIVINGYGFYGDVAELDVEIHSTPTPLGKVATNEDGYFEIKVAIPDSLEEGTHNIVVLYQGREITRQEIKLGAAPANSFLKALTVGFSGGNSELFAGLAVLAALIVLSVFTLLIGGILRGRKRYVSAAGGNAVVGTTASSSPQE